MTITQRAEDLMHKVVYVRSECRGRPLISIAHSLGSILVKGALNESKQMPKQQAYSDLQRSCHATIFMGTPNLSGDIAAWGKVMSNLLGALPGGFSTYSGVLRGLEPDSETLYSFGRRFNDFLNAPIEARNKIQICSVQEGQGMTSVKGAGSKVVPDLSSKFNRADIEQSFFNQTANHMSMCKFATADDQAYKDILGVLKGYCQVLRKRKVADQEKQKATQSALVAGLREKFNYESRLFRERQLNSLSTVDSSLDWIWTSLFAQWIGSDAKMFWIAGHPASGKSTLFFFDYRGKSGIENNFRGLRRSLVYQLLETSEELTVEVEKRFGLHQEGARAMLEDDRYLSSVLDFTLQTSNCSVLLFMEGLDEYEGHKPDLFGLIKHITSFDVKVCLSSRFEIPFSIAFRDTPFQLRMDRRNLPGIETYANATLKASLSPSSTTEAAVLKRAAGTIAKTSHGVFRWAHFAVSEVIDALCHGREIEEAGMGLILRSVPPALNDIYERLFKRLNQRDKQACGTRAETMRRRLFRMFIENGADINAKARTGNVLEYLWRYAHRKTRWPARHLYCQRLIELFIDLGATNETPDPNEIVPTKEHMLAVVKSQGPNRIHMYFYKHGGVLPAPVSPWYDGYFPSSESPTTTDEDSFSW